MSIHGRQDPPSNHVHDRVGCLHEAIGVLTAVVPVIQYDMVATQDGFVYSLVVDCEGSLYEMQRAISARSLASGIAGVLAPP